MRTRAVTKNKKSKIENQKCLCAIPIAGIPEVRPGDPLPDLILNAVRTMGFEFSAGDILVVTHKIVSKSEGRLVSLDGVRPRTQAKRWAAEYGYDARVVELAFQESARTMRKKNGVLITETRHGWICANSGVDLSNVDGGHSAVLLPADADASARKIFGELKKKLGFAVPVIITDTFGRPWREGLVEVAIGVAGMKPFRDYRAQRDRHGYRLRVSLDAVADELAGMAGLACGKLTQQPACIIRGFDYTAGSGRARQLIRPKEKDLFR
ncbi:MAG: coenzyme F420-0:L-glutamate ligase [Terriglobales bacterium]